MTAGIRYGGPQGDGSLGDAATRTPRVYGPARNPVPDTVQIPRDRGQWTDLTISALKLLWNAGYATASIGEYLGLSKNAIVGKSHRLDLPARLSPIIRDGRPPWQPRLRVDGPTLPPLPSDKPRQGEWITEERKEILRNLWPSKTPTRRIMELLEQSPGSELPSQHVVAAYANSPLNLRRPPDIRAVGLRGTDTPFAIPRAPDARPLISRAIRAPVVTLPRAIVVPVVPSAMFTRRAGCCTWTDSECSPWVWCDAPTDNGGSWCPAHHRRVFNHSRYQPVEKLAGMQDAAD